MAEKIIATKDLFLNEDGSAVVHEGPEAAFLLVRAGKHVPSEYADRLPKPPAKPKPKPKARRKTQTKEQRPTSDK